jgi:hypothetical protein
VGNLSNTTMQLLILEYSQLVFHTDNLDQYIVNQRPTDKNIKPEFVTTKELNVNMDLTIELQLTDQLTSQIQRFDNLC